MEAEWIGRWPMAREAAALANAGVRGGGAGKRACGRGVVCSGFIGVGLSDRGLTPWFVALTIE